MTRRERIMGGSLMVLVVWLVALSVIANKRSAISVGFAAPAPTPQQTSGASNAVAYYIQGAALQQAGRCSAALTFFLKAVQLNSMYVAAYRALGACYQSSDVGALDKAIIYYNKALQIDPTNYGIYYDRAGAELNNGNTGAAIADTWQALNYAPPQPPAYISIAQRFDSLTDLADEVKAIQKAIDVAPSNPTYYVAQGDAYNKEGDPASAVADYNRAIHVAPDSRLRATAYANLADIYSGQQDYTDAYQAGVAAIRAAPYDADMYRRSGDIHRANGDFVTALHLYQQSAQKQPYGPTAESTYASEGATYVALNDVSRAYAAYQRAAQLVTTSAQRSTLSTQLADLADSYESIPKTLEAFRFSQLSLSVQPGNVALLLRAAAVHRLAHDLQAALTYDDRSLQRAVALSDREAAYEDKGDTYFALGKMSQAVQQYQEAVRLTSDNGTLSRLDSKLRAAGR